MKLALENARDSSANGRQRAEGATGKDGRLSVEGGGRLSRLLLAKSLAEVLFVVALLSAFSYSHFNQKFRGALDVADAYTVEGWAIDESEQGRRVEVQLFIDGHFVAQQRAERPRPDVMAAGRAARADIGFVFETPVLPPRDSDYEARAYALHATSDAERRTLNQVGETRRFRVAPDERNRRAAQNWWETSGNK